jgi:hypothetical protein
MKVVAKQRHGDKKRRRPGSRPGQAALNVLDRLDEYQD